MARGRRGQRESRPLPLQAVVSYLFSDRNQGLQRPMRTSHSCRCFSGEPRLQPDGSGRNPPKAVRPRLFQTFFVDGFWECSAGSPGDCDCHTLHTLKARIISGSFLWNFSSAFCMNSPSAFGCKSVSSLQVPQLRELMVRICGWQRGNKRDLIKHIWSKAGLSQPYPAAMQYVDFLFSLDSLEVTERANINSGEPLREAWI